MPRNLALVPPVAPQRPFLVLSPHGARADEYYWLRDDTRADPEVLACLAAESAYRQASLEHLAPLKQQLLQEIVGRIRQDDASVPYRKGDYWYYTRYETGQEYPIHARRAGSMQAREQLLLDVNALAAGHDYFQVEALSVSPDGELLAWADDPVGRRQYCLHIKNIATGESYPGQILNAEADIRWAADNRTLLYVEKHPQTLLGYRVRKHVLGTDPCHDPIVWEQRDASFYTRVDKTKDERYLLIVTESTVASEVWYADAADPQLAFKLFLVRERDHEYQVEHCQDRWIVRTNWQARNFRIVSVRAGCEAERSAWQDLVAHDPQGFVHGFEVFRDFLAIEERHRGLRRIRIRPWPREPGTVALDDNDDVLLGGDEPAYAETLGHNPEFDSATLRFDYDSLTTPRSTFEFDLAAGTRRLLKREAVLGDFDPAHYRSEFLWIEARDGTQVPVSLVYRLGTPLDGSAPMLQYAYGAYGYSQDPAFSLPLLSLLDRGFVYALAHVRGGQELGRAWYEAGRQLAKHNTFTDFIDVTRALVARRVADPRRVFARGGSAGGLLMGAVANLAPGDYRGIVSLVPFVDVVTTMLDESIPLTTNEFDEWGNPQLRPAYDCMLSYAPYDNIARQSYPAMYLATGLWDSQVQYFEPAKYVARLRERKTDNNLLVFRVNMEAGHGGKSGRLRRYEEVAEQWAFVLDQAGLG